MKSLISSTLSIVLFSFPVLQLLLLPHVTQGLSIEDDRGHDEVGKKALQAHGIIAAIVFGILMPIAIFASIFREFLKDKWFKIHALLMMISTVLVMALAALAHKATNDLKDGQFRNTHEVVGVIVVLVIYLQVLAAIFRPHPPSSTPKLVEDPASTGNTSILPTTTTTDEKTILLQKESTQQKRLPLSIREIWQVAHKSIGLSILLIGGLQMKTGLSLYSDMYGMNESLNTIYYVWVGIMILFLLIAGHEKLK